MNDIEREEKLKSAKQKLKAFRARQAGKTRKISNASSSSGDEPTPSTSRVAAEAAARKSRHAHRRSSSRQSFTMTATPGARRNSTRRHSRTESICNQHNMVTEIAQPPASQAEAFTTWAFPRSPSIPSNMSPDLNGSPFPGGHRSLQAKRASLQHPPLSPSAGSAVVQSALNQRRASLQLDTSPPTKSTPVMQSLAGASTALHGRRNSRHSRQLSLAGGRESLEVMAGQALTTVPVESELPETDRAGALEALEGRSPVASRTQSPEMHFSDASFGQFPSAGSKRSTWNSSITPSASLNGIAQVGGRGAVDLGMLVEEEEEDQSDSYDVHPMPSVRRRPQSLFLPSGMAAPAPSDASLLSPSDELSAPFSSTPNSSRGFRPLSMVSSPPLSASSMTSPTEAPKRTSGLRSLALSTSASGLSAMAKRNTLNSSTGSNGSSSRTSRRASLGPSPTISKRSSISYRPVTPTSRETTPEVADGDFTLERAQMMSRIAGLENDAVATSAKFRALEAEVTASQAILKAKEVELNAVHAKMASLQAELQHHGELGHRVVDLESQLAEAHETYTAELDALRERCNDAVMERDDLKEDVDGWRTRCADLARTVEREKARADDERREGVLAREQVRKLGDRLAAASTASAAAKENAEEALAEAQARLITEMRDQIFSLAGQLERERAAHAHTRATFGDGHPGSLQDDTDLEAQTTAGEDRESDTGSSASSSFYDKRRSFNIPADASSSSMSTVASDEMPLSRPASFSLPKPAEGNGLPITLGGLQTLAEEEEEETEEDESPVPALEPSGLTMRSLGSGASTCSTGSDAMPKTPVKETAPPMHHNRSHSFLKNWRFPMGSVEQVHIVDSEDNSFFGISQAQVLPPLEVDVNLLELPPFLTSDLVLNPDFEKPSKPQVIAPTAKPLAKEVKVVAPPPPATKPKSGGRMSLANLGSLIGSYVAPPPAPAPKKDRHAGQDSVSFGGDISPKLPTTLARVGEPGRIITAAEAKRPRAGPLSELDFTASCACHSTRTFRI